jgi:hypothetical protein
MSLNASVTSPDLEKQLSLLRHYPEIAEAHFRPAVQVSVALLAGAIRPSIPVLSGRAQATFRSKVGGKGLNIEGHVGWPGTRNAPWYINVVEHGARPHPLEGGSDIRSKRGARQAAKRMESGLAGVPVFISNVGWRTMSMHPGFTARHFMRAGMEASKSEIDSLLAQANEDIVRELAVP